MENLIKEMHASLQFQKKISGGSNLSEPQRHSINHKSSPLQSLCTCHIGDCACQDKKSN